MSIRLSFVINFSSILIMFPQMNLTMKFYLDRCVVLLNPTIDIGSRFDNDDEKINISETNQRSWTKSTSEWDNDDKEISRRSVEIRQRMGSFVSLYSLQTFLVVFCLKQLRWRKMQTIENSSCTYLDQDWSSWCFWQVSQLISSNCLFFYPMAYSPSINDGCVAFFMKNRCQRWRKSEKMKKKKEKEEKKEENFSLPEFSLM